MQQGAPPTAGQQLLSPEHQPSGFSWKINGRVYFLDAGLFFSPVGPDMMLNTSLGSWVKPLQSLR